MGACRYGISLRVEHEKRNSISTSNHVLFSIYILRFVWMVVIEFLKVEQKVSCRSGVSELKPFAPISSLENAHRPTWTYCCCTIEQLISIRETSSNNWKYKNWYGYKRLSELWYILPDKILKSYVLLNIECLRLSTTISFRLPHYILQTRGLGLGFLISCKNRCEVRAC